MNATHPAIGQPTGPLPAMRHFTLTSVDGLTMVQFRPQTFSPTVIVTTKRTGADIAWERHVSPIAKARAEYAALLKAGYVKW